MVFPLAFLLSFRFAVTHRHGLQSWAIFRILEFVGLIMAYTYDVPFIHVLRVYIQYLCVCHMYAPETTETIVRVTAKQKLKQSYQWVFLVMPDVVMPKYMIDRTNSAWAIPIPVFRMEASLRWISARWVFPVWYGRVRIAGKSLL